MKHSILKDSRFYEQRGGIHKLYICKQIESIADLQDIEMNQITQGLPYYVEPWIYYGCSNRGNHGKPHANMGRSWYVMYEFRHPQTGKMKKFIVKDLINTFHKKEDRIRAAEIVRRVVSRRLMNGFNPFTHGMTQVNPGIGASLKTFSDALDFAMTEKKEAGRLAVRTISLYSTSVKILKAVLLKHDLDMPAANVSRQHIKQVVSLAANSPHRYNFFLGMLSSLIEELIEWEIMKDDPTEKIRRKPLPEPTRFEPLTAEEKQIISDALREPEPEFHLFLSIIFETGTRQDEIRMIKGKHIDSVRFWLDPQKETSKKKKRPVPMNKDLAARVKNADVGDEEYLFGKKFKPGPKPISESTIGKWWDRLVRKALGINKPMYVFKHTGATERDEAGLSVEDNRDLMGHSNVQTTRKYIKHKDKTITAKDKALEERLSKINIKF